MKNLLSSGMAILLVVAGMYILFLRECRTPMQPSPDEIIIKKSVWDSIQGIANKPPVIRVDTFKIEGKIVYASTKPIPNDGIVYVDEDSTIHTYKDSLINKEISVWVKDKVKGVLLERKWEYKPMSTRIVETKETFVPQIVNNQVAVSKRGFYVYGIVGGNATAFLPGAGLDFITKKNTMVGITYQRYGNINIFSAKLGFKLGR